jgi:hypothetical protein
MVQEDLFRSSHILVPMYLCESARTPFVLAKAVSVVVFNDTAEQLLNMLKALRAVTDTALVKGILTSIELD